ncbi:hypothetical protein BS50DRAFT_152984 [Corynespora cassiicola Philippines]|uniref:Uncharacterized protein n=1 Tax=Corynespora cassiicola Philippines TaxID=1448308 RepID=A0A2T2N7W9_CORCC|nr:hypothetical protein BS50DRAFT_152984 [Corynespora cassiicola Philippines]
MNYSNMIEEKNLKKTFIIATLCGTLVSTFSSSMGLWERIAEKRNQKKRDTKQDDEIKKLREAVERTERRSKENERNRDRDRDRGREPDNLGYNLERSGAMIQRQYDEGYGRLGRRFAEGDTIAENALQAQIIALQQTVIQVLQDAYFTGRALSHADMAKLVSASTAARENSLDALRAQQSRLALPPSEPGGGAYSPAPRSLALPPPPVPAPPPPRPASVLSITGSGGGGGGGAGGANPLFCPLASSLQTSPSAPLPPSFAPRGSLRCPHCLCHIPAPANDFWAIGKRSAHFVTDPATGLQREVVRTREFQLGQRFLLKCHTPEGEFACTLCARGRDVDTLCATVEGGQSNRSP